MIQKLSHVTVYVTDQDRAKDFYVGTLGFEVRTDATMGPFRWLTVGPKGQPDLELILMKIAPGPMMDEAAANQLRALVEKGGLGCGVLETADVRRDYEELSRKGVRFSGPPEERPYGIETVLRDDSGNWFSLCQRPSSK
ncbi:MAG TPA: VOC family protein [Myxococcales bacterium]|jgi:catechol 2,3-dioxygenase-like lactoylglutathione lyase family enzyme|nr:VOC family protein [Myxococcales bacterium]